VGKTALIGMWHKGDNS